MSGVSDSARLKAMPDRPRLLIADDNADMRTFLAGLLGQQYDVEVVGDGAIALASAQARLPDLVLSDVVMPGLDGFALLRALRDDPRTRAVPVVLVSARAGEEFRVEGLDVGADDYLEKPFKARELVARINANVRLSRMRREVTEQAHRALVAEAANTAKTQFLTAMSHELRTPLNAIAGYVELLELGLHGPITDAQRHALDRIRRSEQRLLGVITDILNFHRLGTGDVHYNMQDVPIHTLLGDLSVLIDPQMRAKHLTYTYIPCAMGDAGDLVIRTDSDRLSQVILNLLSNAMKFTEPGGRVTVACTVSHTDDATDSLIAAPIWNRVHIRVTDTGRGIAPHQLAIIFEPFVQLDRQRMLEGQQGVGLGLSISRDLTQALGGELTIESVEGEGSIFCVTLPRRTASEGGTS